MPINSRLILDRELLKNTDVSLTARVLFAQLRDHGKTNGRINPKRKTLAEELGLSLRTVCNTLGELRDAGWIKSKRRQHANSYTIEREVTNGASEGQGLPLSEGQGLPFKKGKNGTSAPPVSFNEPIAGEPTRAREARFAGSPSEEILPAPLPEQTPERKPMGWQDADPYETYFAAVDDSLRRRGRFLTASEERQLGNIMAVQQLNQMVREGKICRAGGKK